jgi:hypothetical protein
VSVIVVVVENIGMIVIIIAIMVVVVVRLAAVRRQALGHHRIVGTLKALHISGRPGISAPIAFVEAGRTARERNSSKKKAPARQANHHPPTKPTKSKKERVALRQ